MAASTTQRYIAAAGDPEVRIALRHSDAVADDGSAAARVGSAPPPTTVMFLNETGAPLSVFWLPPGAGSGRRHYPTIEPGGRARQSTHVGHVWILAVGESQQSAARPASAAATASSATSRSGPAREGGSEAAKDTLGRCAPAKILYAKRGAVWFTNRLIEGSDPTAFSSVTFVGRGSRRMFDRRVAGGWVRHERVWLLDLRLGGRRERPGRFGLCLGGRRERPARRIEVQVNPEFTRAEALAEADKYGAALGRLPAFLLAGVDSLWIHRGVESFGGGNRNILIHTGMGERFAADGVLEEALVHEATHASLDEAHRGSEGWAAAQRADPGAISAYARDFPGREDLAETMGVYLAVTHRADRLEQGAAERVRELIPHRLAYLDGLGLTMATVT